MKNTPQIVRFSIDASDRIVDVGDDWDSFALENDAQADLFSDEILHRSFWDFISDDTLEHVYPRMITMVRAGESLDFAFRCDSPALRRFLTLRMRPTGSGGVEFETETVRTEEREFQPLFNKQGAKVGELVVACSWCNKIRTGMNVWQEAEDAVAALGLFENQVTRPLSHSMCEVCYEAVTAKMADPRSPAS